MTTTAPVLRDGKQFRSVLPASMRALEAAVTIVPHRSPGAHPEIDPSRTRCDPGFWRWGAQMLSILYVDDSQVQLDEMREALASSPYQLTTATTLPEAKERMTRSKADLVIIDYHMPQLTGDACLRSLRPLAPETTRFYLYTTDAHAFRRHREMGFDGVLMLKGKSPVRAQIDAVARFMTHYRVG